MSIKNLVIVESPAKAKTIEKYLGKDYKVLASYGHVRDLPPKDGSVNPDDDFAMEWELYRDKQSRFKEIAESVQMPPTARLQESGEAFLQADKVPVDNIGSVGITTSYQFDLFGTLQRGIESAQASADAAQAAVDIARITLVADVVRSYTQVCAANEELAIANESLDLQAQSTKLTQRLRDAGRGDETQVTRSQTQFKSLRADLPRYEAARQAGLFRLSMLLATSVFAKLPAPVLTDEAKAKAEEAKAAGADVVGMDDLAADVKAGKMDFDVVIASPDAMRVVGTLGQILGPRGLMPNPKVGTVTPDVATAVKNAKAGQVQFRVDKAGIVHGTIGRRSFDDDKLKGNLAALLEALTKLKPASSKGVYLRKIAVSSTMGVGVRVDVNSITG